MISIKRRSVGDIIANVIIYILLTLYSSYHSLYLSYTLLQRLLRLKRKFKQDRFFFIPDSPTLDAMQEF